MAEIEDILRRFERVRKAADGWSARCPAHDDRHSSLTIRMSESGDVLVRCHAGNPCGFKEIVAAAGLSERDLWGDRRDFRNRTGNRMNEAAAYDYRSETGELLFQVVRFEPKDFRQRRPDGNGGWTYSLNGVRRVLYRLPELIADPKRTVILVEGEKDADRLAADGLLATCNPMGAGKWSPVYTRLLAGRTVAIIPDNDQAGEDHAAAVCTELANAAKRVAIVRLHGLPDKGDVSDWLDAGHTADELKTKIRDALAIQTIDGRNLFVASVCWQWEST